MDPELRVKRLEMEDPTFDYGTTHTAHIPVENPTPESFTYHLVLYLASAEGGTPVAQDEKTFTLAGGGTTTVDVDITMPNESGTWHVYIDVDVAGTIVRRYQAVEDVTVEVAADITIPGPVTWD